MRCPKWLPYYYLAPLFGTLALGGVFLQGLVPVSYAQTTSITSDDSLGTVVMLNGNIYDITSGTRPGNESNLFHSFKQFSVGEGDIASFNGPSGIENILSRVTGGDPSKIFGTIRSTIDGANLFFMNPAGVLFGPEASLEVSGSFHTTTADYLRLGINGIYFADLEETSVLTLAPPEAFGFFESNPAEITVTESILQVPDDKTLSFVGGDVRIIGDSSVNSARVVALSGQVEITSLASGGGEVLRNDLGFVPNIANQSFENLGEVELSHGSLINVSGDKGGSVVIRGGRLVVDHSNIFADTEGDLDSTSVGIDINVREEVVVKNSLITTDVYEGGDAGDLVIKARRVHLSGTPDPSTASPQARIGSLSFTAGSSGDTGNVIVMTSDFEIDGQAEITTTTDAGNGGDIKIIADNVSISGTSNPEDFTGIFSNTFDSGMGGGVEITASNLELTNQAFLQAAARGTGDAGGVILKLNDTLSVNAGSFILVDSNSSGSAGDLTITAESIFVTGISDAPNANAVGVFTGFDSSAEGSGQGGHINVRAENLQVINNGTIQSSTAGSGNGGDVAVMVGQLSLLNGASVNAESISTDVSAGNAGNINLKANSTILIDKGLVTTQAEKTAGGNIKLDAGNLIQLTDSDVTSRVLEGSGEAGNIDIDPDFIVIQNSTVESTAVFGDGGPISLVANSAILVDALSRLDTSSQFGGNGTIDIQAPIKNLSGTIAPLPEETRPVTALYRARCASSQGGHFSTFVDSKVDSLLPIPGRFLASPLLSPSVDQANTVATSVGPQSPVMLIASIAPLVLGSAGQDATACP